MPEVFFFVWHISTLSSSSTQSRSTYVWAISVLPQGPKLVQSRTAHTSLTPELKLLRQSETFFH